MLAARTEWSGLFILSLECCANSFCCAGQNSTHIYQFCLGPLTNGLFREMWFLTRAETNVQIRSKRVLRFVSVYVLGEPTVGEVKAGQLLMRLSSQLGPVFRSYLSDNGVS